MRVITIQIALFTNDLISRPDLLMNNINDKVGKVFDAMPNIINLPLNAPAEIPLAQIHSKDGVYALNVSRNRVDFIISPAYDTNNIPGTIIKKYRGIIEKIYKAVLNSYSVRRLGVVVNLFEERIDNVKAIYDKYIKETIPAGTTEIKVRTNKQQLLRNGIITNNIQDIQASELKNKNSIIKGIWIQLDTNNIAVPEKELSIELIEIIMNHAFSKLKPGSVKELI